MQERIHFRTLLGSQLFVIEVHHLLNHLFAFCTGQALMNPLALLLSDVLMAFPELLDSLLDKLDALLRRDVLTRLEMY